MAATPSQSPAAIILAAGKGTRMKSALPKVVHPVGGRAMVCAVVDACREAGCGRIVMVVGYQQESVRAALSGYDGIEYAVQSEQHGTGHAVQCAVGMFAREASVAGREVFVLCGDGPLIHAETLEKVLTRHRESRAAATLATSVLDNPDGYGRIVRNRAGGFERIVEQKLCTPEQLKINEVNPSYYCFDARELFSMLSKVQRNPTSGEYYITDVPELLLSEGKRVEVIQAVPPEDVLSINTPADLAAVDSIYRSRSHPTASLRRAAQ